jgi:hypothetical protein
VCGAEESERGIGDRNVLLKTPAVKCELTRMSCAMRVVHSSRASKSTRYARFSPSLLHGAECPQRRTAQLQNAADSLQNDRFIRWLVDHLPERARSGKWQ